MIYNIICDIFSDDKHFLVVSITIFFLIWMQQQMPILKFQNIDPRLTIFCVSIKPLRNSTFLLYSFIASGLGLL